MRACVAKDLPIDVVLGRDMLKDDIYFGGRIGLSLFCCLKEIVFLLVDLNVEKNKNYFSSFHSWCHRRKVFLRSRSGLSSVRGHGIVVRLSLGRWCKFGKVKIFISSEQNHVPFCSGISSEQWLHVYFTNILFFVKQFWK